MTDVMLWEGRAGREMLRVTIREFKGHSFADVRRFYLKDGEWRHSPKGCAIPLEHVGAVGAALVQWAAGEGDGGQS